jgi:hypothetical protein
MTTTKKVLIDSPVSYLYIYSRLLKRSSPRPLSRRRRSYDSLSRVHAASDGLSGANVVSSLPRICLVFAKPQGHTAHLPSCQGLNINRPPWLLDRSFRGAPADDG